MQNVLGPVISAGGVFKRSTVLLWLKLLLGRFGGGCKAFWGQILKLIATTELMLSAQSSESGFLSTTSSCLDVNCLEVEVVI